jgi:tRNA nucleotidyltransferase/poly(A) polymerase
MIEQLLPADLSEVLGRLPEAGGRLWLVGGAVRDHFLQRRTLDFDLAVAGEGRLVARRLADLLGGAYYDLDPLRGTARVLTQGTGSEWSRLDIAGLRGGSIEEDLHLRDFTINAMALSIPSGKLLDPTGGLQDLRDKVLSLTGPDSLLSDPVRALRAVRLASELSFRMDGELVKAIRDPSLDLASVSVERIRDELFLMLGQAESHVPLRVANELSLLSRCLPSGEKMNLEEGISRLEALTELSSAFIGATGDAMDGDFIRAQASLRLGRFREPLARDLGLLVSGDRIRRQLLGFSAAFVTGSGLVVPDLGQVGNELHLSGDEVAHLTRISRYAAAHAGLNLPEQVSRLDVYRHYREFGSAGVDIILLGLADFHSRGMVEASHSRWETRVETARVYLQAWYEEWPEAVDPALPIRGHDLMEELELESGPMVGDLLEAVREAQVQGLITDRDSAIRHAREHLNALRASGQTP